ncbi:MAG TPA: LamG-like jellyroll fold domain-containing protein [Candidatus Acidoferrum sp.]|nr:LamG-like jellyroll fold domain-containing protein [Candidatus Acidoferrum sp.]
MKSHYSERPAISSGYIAVCLALVIWCLLVTPAVSQVAGENVNMVSGLTWPYGDPFLERQDEPSIAVSTRNPLHLLAGANDYRSVDLNLPEVQPGDTSLTNTPTGEPWVGQYVSTDGGARWQSTLLPGYPQDTSARGMASPLHGFTTAADPVLASGTNGMFYYGGIAFNRGSSLGLVFVARLMDLNNKENGDISQDSFPIRYINTVPVAYGTITPSQFLDKPAIAADIPRNSNTCSFSVTQSDGTAVRQKIPAGNVYVAYSNVVTAANGAQTSTIYFSRSTNCGVSWSSPIAISSGIPVSQGATIQIDPETGIVYVAWRVIHSTTHPNDGIAITASLNGGQSFFPPLTVASLPPFNFNNPLAPSFFDQGTTYSSFRTTAYPALAVADSGIPFIPGPIYLAWSQRGVGPNGEARIMMLAVPGNASISSNGFKPPAPFPVDNGAVTNDLGGTFPGLTSGHQVMPAMTFNQGKLMVLYYDLRQDHTEGEFTPSVSPLTDDFTPDAEGNFFEEGRNQVAENPTPAYLPYFISDAGLTVRRHTLDVVLAQSNFGIIPQFTYTRVSHYDFGLFEGEMGGETAPFHQLKYDPPNLPMFMKGQASFMGDYIVITGQPFVLVKCGSSQCWTYNNPLPPGVAGSPFAAPKPAPSSAVHYAGFTTNQDVLPPFDNNWADYTPIATGQSIYDPTQQVTGCTPGQSGNEGDRNQNVYASRINQGLVVSSPQVSKPLSSSIQRGFVLLIENRTSGRSTANGPVNYFRVTVANQPVNGFASFAQFVPPSPVPAPPFPAKNNGIAFPLTSVDVAIAPHTGVARTIFAVSSNPTASILVNVTEIDSLGGKVIAGGLSGFLLFNADGTVPANLVDPNGQTGPNSITNVELYNPNVAAPNVAAPNVGAPNVAAPNVAAPNVGAPNVAAPNVAAPNVGACSITNPNVGAPNVAACGVGNPNVAAFGVANPNVAAPNVAAPNVAAAPPSDATYTVTNPSGNTNTTLSVSVTGNSPVPLQLLLSKIYLTPQTDGLCHLITVQQDITLSNVPNVPLIPLNSLTNPNVAAAPVTQPTISVEPGGTALITVRGNVDIPTMQQIVTGVAPVVQPVAINSNNTTATTPPFFAPVFVTTASLPDAVVNKTYSAMVQVIGGKPPYNWMASNLPVGLTTTVSTDTTTLSISGSPNPSNLPGTPVMFTVTDSEGASSQTATRTLTLRVANPLVPNPFTLSPGVQGLSYGPFTFTAAGGISPLTWQLNSGSLDGLVLSSNGTLSGTPTSTGSFPFVLLVSDNSSPSQSATAGGTLVVGSTVTSLLSFVTQPSNTLVNEVIAPAVTVQAVDASHAVLPGVSITLSLTTGPGTLSGTLTQVTDATGTAKFSNLSINATGTGDVLTATAGSITATSNAFNITSLTPQACAPTPGAPISWWPFNGNALDIRGGRPGTLLGDFGTLSQFVPAEVGQGYKPNGAAAMITVPNASALVPVNFTAAAWIRVDGINTTPTMLIVWQGNNAGTDTSSPWALGVVGTTFGSTPPANATWIGTPAPGRVFAILSDGTNELDVFSNTILQTGVFYHVALTWIGPHVGAILYVNGNPENSGTGAAMGLLSTPTNPFQIGGILNPTSSPDSFNGAIDELQVWGSPISQFQIATIYNAGAAGQCQNLWFTETNGTVTNNIGFITPDGATINEFTPPTHAAFPYSITAGPDGNVWFTENQPNKIGEFNSVGGGAGIGEDPITSATLPGTNSSYGALGLTSGPDGQLWFTESVCVTDPCFVGSISTTGTLNIYGVPTSDVGPLGITAGPDGNLWFTETGLGAHSGIAKLTTAGTITEYQTPTGGSNPAAVTTGGDGNLWFTETAVNQIGVITTAGAYLHEFPIPPGLGSVILNAGGSSYQAGDVVTVIQAGASGGTLVIGSVDGNGAVQSFTTGSIGTGYSAATGLSTSGGHGTGLVVNILNTTNAFLPEAITLGPDGNIWFTAEDQNNVLEVTPGGQFTAYPVPKGGSAEFITEGPDGNIWYTDNLNSAIARLVPSTGVTTEFPTPTASSGPWGIGIGPTVAQTPAAPTGVSPSAASTTSQPVISWTASTSPNVIGYNVYHATGLNSTGPSVPYTLANTSLVTSPFTDNVTIPGSNACSYFYYVVTAVGIGNTESPLSTVGFIQLGGGC